MSWRVDRRRVAAISFDCYGTLIDWRTGLLAAVRRHAALSGDAAERLVRHRGEVEWRLLMEMEEFVPYRTVVEESCRIAAGELGIALPGGAAAAVAGSIGDWPPFPDAPEALRRLAERFPLAIASNVERRDLERSLARLGVPFAAAVTADEVRAYKPEPDHFLALLHELALDEFELLHVSAYADYDLATAQDLGIPSVYVDRRGETLPEDVEVAGRVPDLVELARRLLAPGRARAGRVERRDD